MFVHCCGFQFKFWGPLLARSNFCPWNWSFVSHVRGASIARSQVLLDSIYVSSTCNFLLAWLHSNLGMAQQPGELKQKLPSKPSDRAIAALCSLISRGLGYRLTFLSCFQLLIALAVYDTMYLVGAFLEAFRKSFHMFSYLHRVLFPNVIYPMHSMAMTG